MSNHYEISSAYINKNNVVDVIDSTISTRLEGDTIPCTVTLRSKIFRVRLFLANSEDDLQAENRSQEGR